MNSNLISIEEFSRIDLRVAEIKSVEDHPDADKLLVLKIDAGDGIEDRQLVAGIKGHYSPSELVGKKVIIVNNLTPAVLRGVESQGMLLAAQDGQDIVVLSPEKDVRAGAQVC
ncbi:MAG: methionine--tRNA ligase subunit beta [Candidatus Brocadiales bacterium]